MTGRSDFSSFTGSVPGICSMMLSTEEKRMTCWTGVFSCLAPGDPPHSPPGPSSPRSGAPTFARDQSRCCGSALGFTADPDQAF
jgi:hypothetical protein